MYQVALDPTAVTGRRTGAWLLDFVFAGILVVIAANVALTAYTDIPGNQCGDPETPMCQGTLDGADGWYVFDQNTDKSVFVESAGAWVPLAVFVGYGLISFVLIEGVSGGSLGKLILGLRVVTPDGTHAGVGRSLLRFVCWAVDGIPYCFPLVALVTGLTTRGHRRIGDFAAGTFVVGVHDVGQPLSIPGITPPPSMPYVPVAPGTPYGAPTHAGAGWATGPAWAPPTPTTASSAPSDEAAPAADSEPQWDPQRETYIQWDPARNSWLQWDAAANRWKAIET